MARSPTLTAADTEALVYTLLGEAEGEGIDGMRAVASVIVNRTKHGGFASDPVSVVSQPKQFDGGPGTPRYEKVRALYPLGSDEYAQALRVVSSHIAAPNPADATGVNAVFFDTDGKTQQKYAGGTTTRIGRHFFYEQKPGGNAASDVLEATFSGTTSEAWKTAIETQVTRTAQYPLSGTASAYAVETAIGGMNPIYLARASKAQEALAAAGITDAHIWSGYRKPESKVNTKAGSDWSDRSLHGFGLAADWGGIPAYGSADYSAFAKIMKDNGFYNPYPGRADEANHWQIVPDKQIPRGSPLADLRDAWAATGYDINSPLKQKLDAAVASEFDLADIELPGAAMPPLPRRRPTPGQQVADDRAEAIAAAREGARREVMQAIEPGTDAASATRGIPPTAWESSIGPLYDDTGAELSPTEAELSVTPRIEWGIDPDGREAAVSVQMNQPLPGALLAEARRSLFNAPPEAAGVRVSTTFDRGGSFNRFMLPDLPSSILTGIVRANIPMGANGRGGVGRDALDAVRPEGDIQFQSKIDGRPEGQIQFASRIAVRPEGDIPFVSKVDARPEVPGSMPAAPFVSDFPARPETPGALPAAPREGFQPTVAVRPEGEIQFVSRVEGKPDAPIGQMPAADGRRGRGDVGMLVPGNIDLLHRPRVKNADGSISTVRSMSFEEDGVEVLVPTVSNDGRILSDEAAIANYQKTGEFLGKFKNAAAATSYAESLHRQQAALIEQPETIVAGRPDAPVGSLPATDGTPTMEIDVVTGSIGMPRPRPATANDPYVYQIDVRKAAQTVREYAAQQLFGAGSLALIGKDDDAIVAMIFEQKDEKTGEPMIPPGVIYDKKAQTVTTSDRKFAAIIGGLNEGVPPESIPQLDKFVRPVLTQVAGGFRVVGPVAPPVVVPIIQRKTVPTTALKAMMDSTINAPPAAAATVKPKPPSMATVKPAWGVSPPAVGMKAPGRTPQPGNPKTVGDAAKRTPVVETWSPMAAAKPVAPVYKIVPAVYKTVPVVPPAGKVASGAYNVTADQRAAFGGTDAKSAAVVAKAANGTQISAAPAAPAVPAAPQTKRVLVTPERRVAITPKGGVSVREKYVAPSPKRYTAGGRTYVAKNGMLVNEKTGVKYARTVVYGEGGGDYGSSPGQSTAGLKPGDRVYNADTGSWGLKR